MQPQRLAGFVLRAALSWLFWTGVELCVQRLSFSHVFTLPPVTAALAFRVSGLGFLRAPGPLILEFCNITWILYRVCALVEGLGFPFEATSAIHPRSSKGVYHGRFLAGLGRAFTLLGQCFNMFQLLREPGMKDGSQKQHVTPHSAPRVRVLSTSGFEC